MKFMMCDYVDNEVLTEAKESNMGSRVRIPSPAPL